MKLPLISPCFAALAVILSMSGAAWSNPTCPVLQKYDWESLAKSESSIKSCDDIGKLSDEERKRLTDTRRDIMKLAELPKVPATLDNPSANPYLSSGEKRAVKARIAAEALAQG